MFESPSVPSATGGSCLLIRCARPVGWSATFGSEFGTATNRVPPSSVLYSKQAFVNRVETELSGLKMLRIFNGAFADKANPLTITCVRLPRFTFTSSRQSAPLTLLRLLPLFLLLSDENNEIHITGLGFSPISFTSRDSVAGFLGYILTRTSLFSQYPVAATHSLTHSFPPFAYHPPP